MCELVRTNHILATSESSDDGDDEVTVEFEATA